MATFDFVSAHGAFDAIFPESMGAGTAQFAFFPGWASLDPDLEAMGNYYDQYRFNFDKPTYEQPRYFSSYDGAAHGFTLQPVPTESATHLYQLGLETQWHGIQDRHTRLLSPASSGGSMSGSDYATSDLINSPSTARAVAPADTYQENYPKPAGQPWVQQASTTLHQQHHGNLHFTAAVSPSQLSYDMNDFGYSSDAPGEEDFEVADATIAADDPPEEFEILSHQTQNGQHESGEQEPDVEDDDRSVQEKETDNDSEFAPMRTRRPTNTTPLRYSQRTSRRPVNLNSAQDSTARIHKPTLTKASTKPKPASRRASHTTTATTLNNTIPRSKAKPKTKSFPCPFRPFGCPSSFPSKNEWKRHTASQHLQLGFYRCDLGSCWSEHEIKGYNDFNRKDLFTQHARRMHAEECEGLNVGNREWNNWSIREKAVFEDFMEEVRERCQVVRREPPGRSECGVRNCGKVFDVEEGRSWEERMEHVGRHLERGEQEVEEGWVDEGLRAWCEENEMGEVREGRFWLWGVGPKVEGEGRKKRGLRRRRRQEEAVVVDGETGDGEGDAEGEEE